MWVATGEFFFRLDRVARYVYSPREPVWPSGKALGW